MSDSQAEQPITMFEGMRRLASGVSVVTANDRRGERYAMTATSVSSLSGEPPSLLVCINRDARIDAAMDSTPFFCVNLLGPKHKQISINCSTPERGDSRFEHGFWINDEQTGVYYLGDAQAVFFCEKQQQHSYGTHHIYIGNVLRTQVAPGTPEILAYLNGQYLYL